MLIGFLIGAAACFMWLFLKSWCLYADSNSYLLMSGGVTPSGPYRWRVFIPFVLSYWNKKQGPPPYMPTSGVPLVAWTSKTAMFVWATSSWLFLCTSSGLVYILTERAGAPGYVGSFLFCCLPWYRMLSFGCFMNDQLAMMLALACAVVPFEYALPIAIFSGFVHERTPVFAAIFAWNPWLLVGLLPALYFVFFGPKGRVQPYEYGWVNFPLTAYLYHRTKPLYDYFLGWGVCLLGFTFTPQQSLALAIAYGQLIIGRDRSRLYQWAAPLVVPYAALVLSKWPQHWMFAAMVLHLAIPFTAATEVGQSINKAKPDPISSDQVREMLIKGEGDRVMDVYRGKATDA